MATRVDDPARAAYELLAPFYDSYTREYGHERWLANLEAIATAHGLRGNRLLDVGCGTGKSFLPMIERGYEVTGCDISPAMVERAREAAGGAAAGVVGRAGGGRRGGRGGGWGRTPPPCRCWPASTSSRAPTTPSTTWSATPSSAWR